jgi:hypothetical protein
MSGSTYVVGAPGSHGYRRADGVVVHLRLKPGDPVDRSIFSQKQWEAAIRNGLIVPATLLTDAEKDADAAESTDSELIPEVPPGAPAEAPESTPAEPPAEPPPTESPKPKRSRF